MKIVPSILNWSYHHQYSGRWTETLDDYIAKGSAIKKKYNFETLGLDIGIAGGIDALKSHDKKSLAELKKKLDDAGLLPVPVAGTLEIHPEPNVVKASVKALERSMEEALALGASDIQFFHALHGRLSREKGVRVFHDAVMELDQAAQKFGITASTENYCSFTGEELYIALKDAKKTGLLNDVGNWLILGTDPIAATKRFLGITSYVHLKDYIFEDGIWQSVPFGEGIVDLKRALDIFADAPGYRPLFVSLETDLDFGDEDEAMDKSFAFFDNWQKKIDWKAGEAPERRV